MAREFISVEVKDKSVLMALEDIRRAGINPRPMLLEIGEDLAASTKRRFASSTAPDGSRWAANSPTTLARWHSRKGKRGGKSPLIGVSKRLSSSIAYLLRGSHELAVGSPMIYGPTHQFGASKGEFGKTKRGGPIPWGNIPARPFLGLSAEDTATVLRIAGSYLTRFRM